MVPLDNPQQVRVVNKEAQKDEKQCKDVRKRRQEERLASDETALECDYPGCVFVAVNLAGL